MKRLSQCQANNMNKEDNSLSPTRTCSFFFFFVLGLTHKTFHVIRFFPSLRYFPGVYFCSSAGGLVTYILAFGWQCLLMLVWITESKLTRESKANIPQVMSQLHQSMCSGASTNICKVVLGHNKKQNLWSLSAWVQVPVPTLSVPSAKLLNQSSRQSPQLQKEDNYKVVMRIKLVNMYM